MRNIKRLASGPYDVLVVGGGINGAAVAHMAALNGLSVALLDKGDFAGGTSSKSTKLIHGGLRYLEHLELGLVRESLHERFVQMQSAPHLVHRLGFILPVYKKDPRPLWMMRLGVSLYDGLSGKYDIGRPRALTAKEIVHFVPSIKREDLMGGVFYYDAQMNDARLCLENVLSARAHGAHVANYVDVRSLIKENGKAAGVEAVDLLTNQKLTIRARHVVAAVGPWTNTFMQKESAQAPPKVRTTKGVHMVYRGQFAPHAVFQSVRDGRMVFMIPWHGNTLIGTTDTDYTGRPDDVSVDDQDIAYLMEAAQDLLPAVTLSEKNIISTFAGLRPLVSRSGDPSKVSRRHVVEKSYSGIIYIMGGKYTTYRKIAEDCLKLCTSKKIKETHERFPVYGSGPIDVSVEDDAARFGVSAEQVQYLREQYGVRYDQVLNLVLQDRSLAEPLCSCSPAIKAQVVYARQVECAVYPEDIIERRLGLPNWECATGACREYIRGHCPKS